MQKMWEIGRVSDDDLDEALTLFEVVQDMQERVGPTQPPVFWGPEEATVAVVSGYAATPGDRVNDPLTTRVYIRCPLSPLPSVNQIEPPLPSLVPLLPSRPPRTTG